MTEPLRSTVLDPRSHAERPAGERALERVPERHGESLASWPVPARPEPLVRLVIHKANRLVVVRLDDVDWIEGAGNYVRVHALGECHLHRQTLALLHARLDPRRFARIHRSAIVRLDAVAGIESRRAGGCEVELRAGLRLAVSRRYRRELLARLGAE